MELKGQLVDYNIKILRLHLLEVVGSAENFDIRMRLNMPLKFEDINYWNLVINLILNSSINFKVIVFKNENIMDRYCSRVPLVKNIMHMDHNLHNL